MTEKQATKEAVVGDDMMCHLWYLDMGWSNKKGGGAQSQPAW